MRPRAVPLTTALVVRRPPADDAIATSEASARAAAPGGPADSRGWFGLGSMAPARPLQQCCAARVAAPLRLLQPRRRRRRFHAIPITRFVHAGCDQAVTTYASSARRAARWDGSSFSSYLPRVVGGLAGAGEMRVRAWKGGVSTVPHQALPGPSNLRWWPFFRSASGVLLRMTWPGAVATSRWVVPEPQAGRSGSRRGTGGCAAAASPVPASRGREQCVRLPGR